jgi:streptomycin 6-kinase
MSQACENENEDDNDALTHTLVCVSALDLPPTFQQRIRATFREAGAAWLDGLPALLEHVAAQWNLKLGAPFELSYNYVTAATRNGEAVVLKAGVPNPELITEIAAMRIFDGAGAARVLAVDADNSVMLLEQVRPGKPLAGLYPGDDDEATRIAARVMRQLWRPLPERHPFPSLSRWTRSLDRMAAAQALPPGFAPELLAHAMTVRAELLADVGEIGLLHGDLHHFNVLSSDRAGWLLIDPKGVAGEPAFECGPLLLNPSGWMLGHTAPQRVLARRLDILADELGLDRPRLAAWAAVHAVLSACWSVEDGDDGLDALIAARALFSLF